MIEWTQITVGRFNVWKDRGEFMKKKVLVTGIIAVVLAAVLFLYPEFATWNDENGALTGSVLL